MPLQNKQNRKIRKRIRILLMNPQRIIRIINPHFTRVNIRRSTFYHRPSRLWLRTSVTTVYRDTLDPQNFGPRTLRTLRHVRSVPTHLLDTSALYFGWYIWCIYTSFNASTLCAAWHTKYFNCHVVNMLDGCCPLTHRVKYILDTLNMQIRLHSGLFVYTVSQGQLALYRRQANV